MKQVVITKSAPNAASGLKMPGVHVRDSAAASSSPAAARPDAARKLSRMGTSKMHKFKPSVSVPAALGWFVEYGAADASLLFDNNCSALFERGSYSDFEDIRDDDDGRQDDAATTAGRVRRAEEEEDDAEDDEHEKVAPPATVEGEKFRLGQRQDDD